MQVQLIRQFLYPRISHIKFVQFVQVPCPKSSLVLNQY